MKRALALMLSVGVLGGCFPHNPQARTYAKYTEGALILAGIGAEAIASRHTGANCDMQTGAMGYDANCHTTSTIYGGVGLAMILAGLTGFIATVSTAEDEKEAGPPLLEVKKPDKPDVKLPPGVTPTPSATPADAAPAATPSESAAAPQKPAP
jgi:hypothetical protein